MDRGDRKILEHHRLSQEGPLRLVSFLLRLIGSLYVLGSGIVFLLIGRDFNLNPKLDREAIAIGGNTLVFLVVGITLIGSAPGVQRGSVRWTFLALLTLVATGSMFLGNAPWIIWSVVRDPSWSNLGYLAVHIAAIAFLAVTVWLLVVIVKRLDARKGP